MAARKPKVITPCEQCGSTDDTSGWVITADLRNGRMSVVCTRCHDGIGEGSEHVK